LKTSALTALVVIFGVIWAAGGFLFPQSDESGPQAPFGLRCEYLKNPAAIDIEKPRFSWSLGHSDRGRSQFAYQILVSTEKRAEKGDIWDTGKEISETSVQVEYGGAELESNRTYYWKVRYWDDKDQPSPYSEVQTFGTAILDAEVWEAKWISGHNLLRKGFTLDQGKIRTARIYIAGLGYYELSLNGRKVGTSELDPAWTTYDKHVLYAAYDVGERLLEGENVLAVMLGNGWYKSTALILQLMITFENGEELVVVSDESWKSHAGPLLQDSIYDGEVYDARLEIPGWDGPGFDDEAWENAETAITPQGVLRAQMMPPIRVVDTLLPVKRTNPRPGVYIYDMGQNFSGWVELSVRGPRGTRIRLRHAELLHPDGELNRENLRAAKAEDIYICRGGEEEAYHPRFTYHGFRYVEVSGYPGTPPQGAVRGMVVHTAVEQTGSFSCSTEILNDLQRVFLWGYRTNLHGIPTDCCQRDERMGWLGDAHLTAEMGMMNFDMAAFYTKFIQDISDVQDNRGRITDTVPHIWGQRPADPAWGTAYPLLCWYVYRHYGDKRILEDHYDGLKAYVDFLKGMAKKNILEYSYYGDWVSIDPTPGSLVSTCFYYYDVKILADIAAVLGRDIDHRAYRSLQEEIKKSFHEKFFDPETGSYATNSQTSNALPLFLGMVPQDVRGRVHGNLTRDILYNRNTHISTGIMGTKYLPFVVGFSLAYDLLTQTTYPSWGYMLRNGATTLWELWQNKTGPGMNSHNHPMMACVGIWFYRTIAGIDQPEDSIGFKRIRISPAIGRDLKFADGSIRSLYGRISCRWIRTETGYRLHLDIPVNCTAELLLPVLDKKNPLLMEGETPVYTKGRFLTGIEGITMVDENEGRLVVSIGSGRYTFELKGD
jgi:alpha-L-rhamnosidase